MIIPIPELLEWARKTRLKSLGETYKQDFNSDHIMNIRDYLKMLIDNAEIVVSETRRINACINNVQNAIGYLKKCGVNAPGNVREDIEKQEEITKNYQKTVEAYRNK